MAVADGSQRVVVAALAVEVDGENCTDAAALAPPVREGLVEKLRIHRPGRGVAVHEHRLGSGVPDRVRARGERERRADHLVAGTDVEDGEGQMEGGRPAREGKCVRDIDDVRAARTRTRRRAARVGRASWTRSPRRRARSRDLWDAVGRGRYGASAASLPCGRSSRPALPAHRPGPALERSDEIARDPAAVEAAGLGVTDLPATVQLAIGAGCGK